MIGKVQDTMRDIRKSNKNSAALRDFTHWRPMLPGNTRWTGNHDMIAQFNKIHVALEEAYDDANNHFRIDKGVYFNVKAIKYEKCLSGLKNWHS